MADPIPSQDDAIRVPLPGGTPGVVSVAARLADRAGAVVLESVGPIGGDGRFCFLADDPAHTLVTRVGGGDDPFAQLEAALRAAPIPVRPGLPFRGGWIGSLGYEAGRRLERLPGRARNDLGLPEAWFGLYDTVAIYDRLAHHWTVTGVELPAPWGRDRRSLTERMQVWVERIREAPCAAGELPVVAGPHAAGFDRGDYEARVARVKDHILAGDVYQANLTQCLRVPWSESAWSLYRHLRHSNPANYAAFLNCGAMQVLSSSPELFLEIAGGVVRTRPIKGTRPRGLQPHLDAMERAALLGSAKDHAELAMIVDLERNDLARVCDHVMAVWPPDVETHPTVHHLVGTVRGRLRPGIGAVDVLRCTFPSGSITGAPKIRAMEIIDDLEPVIRGPYCGAIGYLGLDGSAMLNVAIRTLIVTRGVASVHVGGGIVADSVPASEYAEIVAKAAGMMAALRGGNR